MGGSITQVVPRVRPVAEDEMFKVIRIPLFEIHSRIEGRRLELALLLGVMGGWHLED
ncbi:hypothetical protein BVRB_2g037620 isoform A [Beta vulgaris subsp. vulgaris]|nr:hypothetical protein BVRB_2g037620 isoform A [Beta vulgaris subsp. vulgaris]